MAPVTRSAALQRDEDGELDERAGTGMFHRSTHLRGWRKHLHGYGCPRCGTTCHDKPSRDVHDKWHRDQDEWDEEWQELVEALEERIKVLEAQHAFIAETFGHALAPLVGEGEPS